MTPHRKLRRWEYRTLGWASRAGSWEFQRELWRREGIVMRFGEYTRGVRWLERRGGRGRVRIGRKRLSLTLIDGGLLAFDDDDR